MEKSLRKCKRCGAGYQPNRFWQLFCCIECKKKFEAEERKIALEAYRGREIKNPRNSD